MVDLNKQKVEHGIKRRMPDPNNEYISQHIIQNLLMGKMSLLTGRELNRVADSEYINIKKNEYHQRDQL